MYDAASPDVDGTLDNVYFTHAWTLLSAYGCFSTALGRILGIVKTQVKVTTLKGSLMSDRQSHSFRGQQVRHAFRV